MFGVARWGHFDLFETKQQLSTSGTWKGNSLVPCMGNIWGPKDPCFLKPYIFFYGFHMILYGLNMILSGFYMILYGFYMILYSFHINFILIIINIIFIILEVRPNFSNTKVFPDY